MVRLADNVEYVTVGEAAKILKVTNGRVYQLITEQRISSMRTVGRILLPKIEVRHFARIRSRRPGPVPRAEESKANTPQIS